jgi:hypothetical protein
METEKNPFEAVRAMMLENLEKVGGATQSYLDMVEKTMRGFPGANEEQIGTFKAYIERQVATNREFAEKLLSAKDSVPREGVSYRGALLASDVAQPQLGRTTLDLGEVPPDQSNDAVTETKDAAPIRGVAGSCSAVNQLSKSVVR